MRQSRVVVNVRARMRDVAALAGVGTMTVSRVLRGNVPVSKQTRDRVLAAIAQLDYRPNQVARSLRESRSRSIGIIVPNFYDTFFASCAHGVSQVAQRAGYSVMVTTSAEDAAEEYREASLMVSHNIDGLVVIPAWNGETRLNLPEFAAVPIVTLDRPLAPRQIDFAFRGSVMIDNLAGARCGVEHLIGHGHTKILYLSLSNDLYTLKARHMGYDESMRDAGLAPEGYFTCATQESTLAVLQTLQDEGRMPTAIFSSNNLVTQHALHALSALHLNIPKDIALIGFDDLQMFDIFMPPITVIRQPLEELGRAAGEMLLDHIQSAGTKPSSAVEHRDVTLSVELVIRRSCGCMG